jgi:hypothetical protein
MTRLSLQVFYLWCHVSSTAPPFILWWTNLEILFGPLPPQLFLHRRAALSSNSKGTRSVNSRENPKRSLYCEMSVVVSPSLDISCLKLERGHLRTVWAIPLTRGKLMAMWIDYIDDLSFATKKCFGIWNDSEIEGRNDTTGGSLGQ